MEATRRVSLPYHGQKSIALQGRVVSPVKLFIFALAQVTYGLRGLCMAVCIMKRAFESSRLAINHPRHQSM